MDLTVLQGRTARYLLGPLIEADNDVLDLSNHRLRWMVKSASTDLDANAVLDYDATVDGSGVLTGAGFTMGGADTTQEPEVIYTDAVQGVVTLTVNDADTRTTAPGSYVWELVIMPTTGEVFQLLSGNLTVTDTLIDAPETP